MRSREMLFEVVKILVDQVRILLLADVALVVASLNVKLQTLEIV